MTDYYQILGIQQGSSLKDIKKSFRRKAKQLHPDLNIKDKVIYEEEMRVLLKAYEVLTDPYKREEYDRTLAQYYTARGFDYREYLKRHSSDPYCLSKLIFYDLLHNNYHEAVNLYKLSTERTDFYLEKYLSREDFMDCAFLLAEAFEMETDFIMAWKFYKKIYLFEIEKPYFHHFVEEVIERLRNLVCFKMQGVVDPTIQVGYLESMIGLNISKKYTAFFYKKIAEIYSTIGENEIAVRYLRQGLELNKKLAGVKKLKEKIGYEQLLAH